MPPQGGSLTGPQVETLTPRVHLLFSVYCRP